MRRAKMRLDIHSFEKQYTAIEEQLRKADISQRNKDLILQFRDTCLLQQVCNKVRLIKIIGELLLAARDLHKDFDQATKEDLQRLVTDWMSRQPPYAPETLKTKKTILKRFMAWIYKPDDFPFSDGFPKEIKWLKTHLRKRDRHLLQRKDLLTPGDVQKLLTACRSPRDKAFIATLWETGARVSEIGNLQLRHVTKQKHGYILALKGKTGERNVLVVSAAPYLSQWISVHPFAHQDDAPLWIKYKYTTEPEPLTYASIRRVLARLFVRAKINKPMNPHLWRHSRCTFCIANGIFNESTAKTYFGWTPDSDMLSIYSHLIDQDANNAILRENNLTTVQKRQDELKPITCTICGELNPPQTHYCTKCSAVLNMQKAYEHQRIGEEKDALFVNLFKILVEKGLMDEAVEEIHKADLGLKLKRLAQHITEERHITAP